MLSIFIPQEKLEDIVIDNMASDMEPENQDVWFKVFTKQDVIYVSSWDEKKYLTAEDPLFHLTESYNVEIRYETKYIEAIPHKHELVTQYWNGIFLLDISEEDAAEIQHDYGVICQSIKHMDFSVLKDPGLRFSPKKGSHDYSWEIILNRISAEYYPSNRLFVVDRYLFSKKKEFENALINIFNILNVMLPTHKLKCPYRISLIIGQQEKGDSVPLSQITRCVCELIPYLKRPYTIDIEVFYHTHLSGLYTSSHNRCILTNYTVTQLEHMLNAFENGESRCMQTILPQGLFTMSGLDGYCDSPHKTHHDVMTAIYDNLVWWVKNYLTPKSTYTLNGKEMKINTRYEIKTNGTRKYLFELNS